MAEDWLRKRDWSPNDQREFEARLARSRRKADHLSFKAGVLSQSENPDERAAAIQLWERVIRDFPSELREVAAAHQSIALELTRDHGWDPDRARDHLRACIEINDTLRRRGSGTTYEEQIPELQLAELLIGSEDEPETREANRLLNKLEKSTDLFLPEDQFRHAVASARVASRLHQLKKTRAMAKRAPSFTEENEVELGGALRQELESLVRPTENSPSNGNGGRKKFTESV